jgi:hypothetical protein
VKEWSNNFNVEEFCMIAKDIEKGIVPEVNNKEQARSFSSFLQMLEDGQFHSELSDSLQELNANMNNHVLNYGQKAKGKISITIEFVLEKGVFDIVADFKSTPPKTKRARSIAWSTPNNNFTPENPRQMNLFGVRDVTSNTEIRKI